MRNREINLYPKTELGEENESVLEFREIIRMYIYRWPLFIAAMAIMVALAVFYCQKATPTYTSKAKVLLKDNSKTDEKEDILKELTLQTDDRIVENELEIFKSKTLMSQVVGELDLDKEYVHETGGGNKHLYEDKPISITYFNSRKKNFEKQQLIIHPISGEKYDLQFSNNRMQRLEFNKRYKNKAGEWEIAPNSNVTDYLNEKLVITVHQPDLLAYELSNRLQATHVNDQTSVIELSYSDNLPQRGKDILNTLIHEYNRLHDIQKDLIADNTLNFLNARLSTLAKELNQVEKDAAEYRSTNKLTDLTSQSKVFLENVQENDNALKELDVQLAVLNGVEKYVHAASSASAPPTLGIADPALAHLINELTKLKLARENLLATTPEGNPVFETVDRQIRSLQESIRDNVGGLKKSLLAAKGKINNYNSKFETAIRRIPAQERQLVDIKRQQSIKEGLYVYLLQKQEELSLKYASAEEDNRIIDQAYTDERTWPNKPLIFGVAFFMGILIPGSFLWGRNYLTNRIKTRAEIEKAVPFPILGELNHERTRSPLVVVGNRRLIVGEQFRSLRTSLRHLHGETRKGCVTLVTSSVAGEGKSFVSANLGAALGAANRKTVLLELDLRKPRLGALFEKHNGGDGVSNLIFGETDLSSVIKPVQGIPNLYIITCGTRLNNPAETLEREELGNLVRNLRLLFDDIVIDSPPVHLVADAVIIAKHVDTSLYIVRQGITSRNELSFIHQLSEQELLPNVNLVFNALLPQKYGYGYHLDKKYYQDTNLELP